MDYTDLGSIHWSLLLNMQSFRQILLAFWLYGEAQWAHLGDLTGCHPPQWYGTVSSPMQKLLIARSATTCDKNTHQGQTMNIRGLTHLALTPQPKSFHMHNIIMNSEHTHRCNERETLDLNLVLCVGG